MEEDLVGVDRTDPHQERVVHEYPLELLPLRCSRASPEDRPEIGSSTGSSPSDASSVTLVQLRDRHPLDDRALVGVDEPELATL
ncbi:MAG: hypothetical protein R2716_06345 [Microthrixaceae bacterium]